MQLLYLSYNVCKDICKDINFCRLEIQIKQLKPIQVTFKTCWSKRNVTLTENSLADFLMASVKEIYRSWKKKTESCCKMFIALHWERKTFLNNKLHFLVLNKRYLRTIFSLSEVQIVYRIYNKHFSVSTQNEVCKWSINTKIWISTIEDCFNYHQTTNDQFFLFCFVHVISIILVGVNFCSETNTCNCSKE